MAPAPALHCRAQVPSQTFVQRLVHPLEQSPLQVPWQLDAQPDEQFVAQTLEQDPLQLPVQADIHRVAQIFVIVMACWINLLSYIISPPPNYFHNEVTKALYGTMCLRYYEYGATIVIGAYKIFSR